MKKAFKTYFWLFVVLVVAVGAFLGGLTFGLSKGRGQGRVTTEARLQPLLDYAFPKPAADLRSLTGTVKNIYGAEITLDVNDPDDYLPHLDGTARAVETRTVSVSSETQIVLIDTRQIDSNGNAKRTPLQLSSVKNGDRITVFATENIRDAQQFDAVRIELVQY